MTLGRELWDTQILLDDFDETTGWMTDDYGTAEVTPQFSA